MDSINKTNEIWVKGDFGGQAETDCCDFCCFNIHISRQFDEVAVN